MLPPAIIIVAPADMQPMLRHRLEKFHDWPLIWQTTNQTIEIEGALHLWINLTLDEFLACAAQGQEGIDLILAGDPLLAQQLGWMIAAGGTITNLNQLTPLIDALAPPLPWAWLHAGGAGAGAFATTLYRHWQRQQQAVLDWLAGPGVNTRNPMQHFDPASWQTLAQIQLSALQTDARRYVDWAEGRSDTHYQPHHPCWHTYLPNSIETAEPALQLAKFLLTIGPLPNLQ